MQAHKQLLLLILLLAVPRSAAGQGYAPDAAVEKMHLPDGLTVRLVAAEPEVRQPILVKCDDRGRLWTIQYLQYPNPAGLKRVKVDRWSRTVYDRIPEPPPKGPRGADRITILEDADGDGRAEKVKDFITGLNLCTGIAFGHGGVFVLQVPYLLFYPDRNRDDVPDSDPQVLLKGFGMEDAQSLANHLTWGPDGWLYGVNGSTTTCNVRGIEFQQGCWRYHPRTEDFELFCEGGGNTYGLTFDDNGNLFYSTNGGPFVHAVQGGYYYKSFGKHGPVHNAHAYHHFGPLERDQVPGGPPTGGTVYLGDSFPAKYRGTFIAGNFLGHTSSWWHVEPRGNTVRARYGGLLLDSRDTWFGPTDMCLGPDGSMYVCDFHDLRTAHPDPDADWDRGNGRIYKIEAKGTRRIRNLDLQRLTGDELVGLLSHRNRWYAGRARVILAGHRDPTLYPQLRKLAFQSDDRQLALQGLWALYVSGGLNDGTAERLLDHPAEYVRSWTVRLLGDRKQVSRRIADRLVQLAGTDPSAVVRAQLAATAKRLPARNALPIVVAILDRDADVGDARIPWLLWWAVEAKAVDHRDLVLKNFTRPGAWANGSYRGNIRRLMRRYAAEGTTRSYQACLQLLQSTTTNQLDSMYAALAQGLAERSSGLTGVGQGGLFQQFAAADGEPKVRTPRKYQALIPELQDAVERHWRAKRSDPFRLKLAILSGIVPAYEHVLNVVSDGGTGTGTIAGMLGILQKFGRPDCVPVVLPLLDSGRPENIQLAVIDVLNRFARAETTARLIALYPTLSKSVRPKARAALFSRLDSATAFLKLVDGNKVPAKEIPIGELRRLAVHEDDNLNAIVRRHWGNVGPGTPEQKLAAMRRFNNDLRAGGGDARRGRELFKKHCANCHSLFGEGNKIGPDLTTANRKDRAALLANIVDPNAVVRREHMSYVAVTDSGRVVTGLIVEQNAATVTLLDAKNKKTTLSRTKIEVLRESSVSLMPEKLLDQLRPQERRDLFVYLQK